MTPDEIRIAVAECLGWEVDDELEDGALIGHHTVEGSEFKGWDMLPDYPNDLNACAEFEATLSEGGRDQYVFWLSSICRLGTYAYVFAPALQRCEAFLRVKGKWQELKGE